jgi:DNA-binding transcriptional ArsR family regulator
LFDAFASVAQALGSGRRAEIVDVLAQGERSVEEIAIEIDQSLANTSQHLQLLLRAGLVRSRRQGTRIYYRLASDRVGDLWAAVREVAERHVAEGHVYADDAVRLLKERGLKARRLDVGLPEWRRAGHPVETS